MPTRSHPSALRALRVSALSSSLSSISLPHRTRIMAHESARADSRPQSPPRLLAVNYQLSALLTPIISALPQNTGGRGDIPVSWSDHLECGSLAAAFTVSSASPIFLGGRTLDLNGESRALALQKGLAPLFNPPLACPESFRGATRHSPLPPFTLHSHSCYGSFTFRSRRLATIEQGFTIPHTHHAYRNASAYGTLLPMRAGARDPFMKRVLIIEDDRDIVELVRYNLANEGFQVTAAFDGPEAWPRFAKLRRTCSCWT